MKNVNVVFLLGNVSRDPEIKETTGGRKIAVFGIATNRDWKLSGGEKSSSTEFHNCIVWGKLADLCENYLKKGQLVHAEGYLKTRSWEDESGKRNFRTEVVLTEIIILEKFSKKEDEEGVKKIMNKKDEDEGNKENNVEMNTNIDEPLFDEEK